MTEGDCVFEEFFDRGLVGIHDACDVVVVVAVVFVPLDFADAGGFDWLVVFHSDRGLAGCHRGTVTTVFVRGMAASQRQC